MEAGFGNPLIGREQDLQALNAAFASGDRLVCVVGVAGVGKTRLAAEYAARHRAEYPGGVLVCDLTEARDAAGACLAVASAADVVLPQGDAGDAVAHLARAIAARGPCLVVLDNLEQLVDAAPATLGRWRALCPDARFLVTSRERTRVEGERACEVEPLALLSRADADADADAGPSDAVALLLERAGRAGHAFARTAENAAVLEDIARALDGLPLAIELAAARMGVLGPDELLARLARRFEVLSRGARGAGARQATLRGALDGSWDLLTPDEREALARCAVFRGGFALDAAEAVLAPAGGASALDVVQSLRDKSLLRAYAPEGLPNELRYGLLLSIREYAAERLAASPEARERAERRHAEHYVARAEAWSAEYEFRGTAAPMHRLIHERDNLGAVVARMLAPAPPDAARAALAARAVAALESTFRARGPLGAYVTLLESVLALRGVVAMDPAVAARLYVARVLIGGGARAADADEAVALAERSGEPAVLGRALFVAAGVRYESSRVADALAMADRCEAVATQHRSALIASMAAAARAKVWVDRREFARAELHAARAVEQARAAGNRYWEGVGLMCMSVLLLEQLRLDDALATIGRSRAIYRAMDERRLESRACSLEGIALQLQGRIAESLAAHRAGFELQAAIGDVRPGSVYEGYFGVALCEAMALDEARERLRAAVATLHERGALRYVAAFLGFLGGLEATAGNPVAAREAFAQADALGLDEGEPLRRVCAVQRAHFELVQARDFEARGDAAGAEARRAAARALLAAGTGADGRAEAAHEPVEVSLARRILEHAHGPQGLSEARAGAAPGASASGALVLRRAGWLCVAGAEPVDCRKRQALWLIVSALAEQRIRAPGEAMSAAALIAAGWPGEKMRGTSARNRLYVTLNRLRALGLRDALVSAGDGYLIDPAVSVRVVDG